MKKRSLLIYVLVHQNWMNIISVFFFKCRPLAEFRRYLAKAEDNI